MLRRSIVDAFIALVGRVGFDATTLDAVAAELGMRRNHVGYYYPSRQSLLHASVQRVISLGQQITIQKVESAKDWRAAFAGWVTGAFDWLEVFPTHGNILLVFFSQCAFDKGFDDLNSSIFRVGIERAATKLRAQREFSHLGIQLEETLCDVQTFNFGILIQQLTAKGRGESWARAKERAVSHGLHLLEPLGRRLARRR